MLPPLPFVGAFELAEHRLDGGELLQAFDAEFDAEAGLLDAAERRVRLNGAVLVDPHRARLDTAGDALGRLQVGSPDRAAKAHRACVGLGDCFFHIMIADDRERRTELFLVDQTAAMIDVGDERDRIKIARAALGIAADQHATALLTRLFDEG